MASALLAGPLHAPARAETSDLLRFENRCLAGERLTIAAVGDLIFQAEIQREVLRPDRTYGDIWSSLAPVLRHADMVYGNLEGPVAQGIALDEREIRSGRHTRTSVYGTPAKLQNFNYHPSLLDDLKRDGFSVVSTANNHALDRGAPGIDRTIDNLERRNIALTGTRRRNETAHPWSAVTEARGMRIAWLACTYGTNGRPDRFDQVLHCYSQRDLVLDAIRRHDADPEIQATILVPHWGIENSDVVQPRQQQLGLDAIAAGALAVIGTHPHVLQSWEKAAPMVGRQGLVIHSTGNFVSNQLRPDQRLGMIAVIQLVRPPGTKKAKLAAAGYILTQINKRPRYRVTEHRIAAQIAGVPTGNRISAQLPLRIPSGCEPTAPATGR